MLVIIRRVLKAPFCPLFGQPNVEATPPETASPGGRYGKHGTALRLAKPESSGVRRRNSTLRVSTAGSGVQSIAIVGKGNLQSN